MIKLALIQMRVSSSKKENIEKAVSMIKEAARNKADLVVLPEIFNSPYDNSCFEAYSEIYPGETSVSIGRVAKEESVYVVAGSIPENDGGKIYNTSYVYNREGEMIARHRKMHLFDINIEGGQYFMESDVLTPGDDFTVFDTEFCKIGLGICFDVRFPEYFRVLSEMGAKLVILPAAFNMTTGPAHWELSLRMRAVDNQLFMAAASPARDENSSYVSYSHSMITDPWGRVIIDAGIEEKIVYSDIDLTDVDKIRNQLPIIKGLRRDMYSLEKK